MTEPTEGLAALRKAFPASVVGKLPKGNTTLDYVGHAAVTDRLLTADPSWSWEPLALDPNGLPLYDKNGGLWIRLTVCGVTRLGYGDGPDPKQRIGDAIRNGAMRFGVALDLWTKGELESQDPNGGGGEVVRPARREPVTDQAWREGWIAHVSTATTKDQLNELWRDLGRADREGQCSATDLHDLGEVWKERARDVTVPPAAETAKALTEAMKAVEAGWPKVAEVPA